MKTRRKASKTPSKNRRSSVICVKKSPINRRTSRRILRSQTRCSPAVLFTSPLKFGRSKGPESSSSRSTNATSSAGDAKVEDVKVDEIETKLPDILELSLSDEPVDQIDEKKVNVNSKMANSTASSSSTSKRKAKVDMLTAIQNRKKRKTLKKSPLSRFNESDDKTDESIIILDDSESLPDTKAVLTETKNNVSRTVNTSCQIIDQSIVKTEPLTNFASETNSDEVIVIDCDSSFMEMEAYHEAFKQNEDWLSIHSNENWSPTENENMSPINSNEFMSPTNSNENWLPIDPVIVIPDDDSPIQTRHTSPKPTEKCLAPIQTRPTTPKTNDDCFVVWSSLPIPSTSNADPPKPSTLSPKCNTNDLKFQIYLDTNPDMSNLRFLNNENDKPKRNIKSTKDTTKTKKSLLKSPKATKTATKLSKSATKPTKAATKLTKTATSTSKTATSTSKTATTMTKTASAMSKGATATSRTATVTSKTATATSKTANATLKTTVKKRTKNKGELIFLSESQEEDGSAKKTKSKKGKLREIVIDGSNVAMAYTHSKMFSEKGIKMLIDYFTKRGHSVKVFVPQYRRSRNFPLLEKWYTDGIVVFTPSRKLGNKTFTPYDDRYILEYATARNGIVVSQDQFRDLYAEKPEYRDTIENRILVPTFVGDYVMFPEDPLGRDGPSLSEFLKY